MREPMDEGALIAAECIADECMSIPASILADTIKRLVASHRLAASEGEARATRSIIDFVKQRASTARKDGFSWGAYTWVAAQLEAGHHLAAKADGESK